MPRKSIAASMRDEPPWVLQPRDDEIVRWTNRHGVVNVTLIAKAFFEHDGPGSGIWAGYTRVRKLRQLGLLERKKVRIGVPDAIRVSRGGAQAAGLGLEQAPAIPHDLEHVFAVVDLLIDLERKYPEAEIITERLWRQRIHREIRAGTRPKNYGRIPDAVLRFADGKEIAVELERGSRRSREFEKFVAAYNLERFYRVWWFCRSEAIANRLRVVIIQQGADKIHEVFVRGG